MLKLFSAPHRLRNYYRVSRQTERLVPGLNVLTLFLFAGFVILSVAYWAMPASDFAGMSPSFGLFGQSEIAKRAFLYLLITVDFAIFAMFCSTWFWTNVIRAIGWLIAHTLMWSYLFVEKSLVLLVQLVAYVWHHGRNGYAQWRKVREEKVEEARRKAREKATIIDVEFRIK